MTNNCRGEHCSPNNNMRILFGPIHIAGNFLGYSQGLKKLGIPNKIVVTEKHPFKYGEEDILCLSEKINLDRVNIKVENGKIKAGINIHNYKFLKFINNFDVFHFTFGHSLLPENKDIPVLKARGKKIVMQFCGCDLRCREIILNEKWPASVCDDCKVENSLCRLEDKKKLAEFWEKHADAIISHPEYSQLLTKKYHHFKIGIDTEKWKPGTAPGTQTPEGRKILIVHAPSSPELKGTKYILQAVDKLKKERDDFEFTLLENIPNEKLKKILSGADIAVDQILAGWYGHFAVECMALGKPVLVYVGKKWREEVSYAREVPVLNTTKENIYENLKSLINDGELRKELGKKSRIYVEKTHDSVNVAQELLRIYQNL